MIENIGLDRIKRVSPYAIIDIIEYNEKLNIKTFDYVQNNMKIIFYC